MKSLPRFAPTDNHNEPARDPDSCRVNQSIRDPEKDENDEKKVSRRDSFCSRRPPEKCPRKTPLQEESIDLARELATELQDSLMADPGGMTWRLPFLLAKRLRTLSDTNRPSQFRPAVEVFFNTLAEALPMNVEID